MITTDPIADMLTRMRNALTVKHNTVTVPASKMKVAIAELLKNEGYINEFSVTEGAKSSIVIDLKYGPNNQKVINGLKRISKPGLRIYAGYEDLPKVLNGLGIAIISTSKGLMTDRQAREQKIGGEVLAYVW
ncbi:MAG: 30S ribosomal protein S8 [Clostridia bacterium]|jgi:small subunit ribosomal protein S8|nr:30S ribosomal protein S8 [Clostridia bacterium]